MENESLLKKAGGFALALSVVVVIFLIIGMFIYGMVWASAKALPWLIVAGRTAFDICVLALLPLCIFRRTRPWAGLGFFVSSYLFGTVLFAFSCIVVFEIWGFTGLFIGLALAGGGVVPVAFLATLFHGEWFLLWNVVFGIVLTFGTRFLGIRLSTPKHIAAQEEVIV